jgi:hypothetical protein
VVRERVRESDSLEITKQVLTAVRVEEPGNEFATAEGMTLAK